MHPEVRANILVVNDRPEQLVALSTVLEPLGENLVLARSGEEALRKLLQQEFAVVLLDVHMPGMDGFETAALVRQRERSHSTPIIFVTAYGQGDKQIEHCYSLGAVDFIQTPVVPEILRGKVGVFAQLYKQSEELRLLGEVEHRRELAMANQKLESETERNLFFVRSIDLLAVAGFDGRFKQTNPAWGKVLGYSEEDLRAQPFCEFAHPEDQASAREQLEGLKQGKAILGFEHRFRCKNGDYRWLGWTASPSAADELIYIFAREITERKQAEAQIRCLNRKLEDRVTEVTNINHELEAFSYSISHDLRAPLRSMQGFAQLLKLDFAEQLPEEGRLYASRIVESAAYMDQLLRDLLEYSRVNRVELSASVVELESVLGEVLDSIQNEIRERGAEIEVERPLASVLAHRATVKQILTNLVANAMKFVAPGVVPKLRIWSDERPGAGGQATVRVWVQDNGIGIAADLHERIFGLFQRGQAGDRYPGTGVGLAIVRKGAERMRGQVGLESGTGQGSCFWFELPAAQTATPNEAEAA